MAKQLKIGDQIYKLTRHSRTRFRQRFGKGFDDMAILNLCYYGDNIMEGYKVIWKPDLYEKNVWRLVTILFDGKGTKRYIN